MPRVTLISYTPQPEQTVAAAAKLCYSQQGIEGLLDGITPENAASFIKMLVSMGHESPVEHVSFTFGVEGISRSLLAQLTRHRIASYSVQSQRYVKLDPPLYITPPQISECPEALAIFEESMRNAAESYAKITGILLENQKAKLLAQGLTESRAQSTAEKLAIEDARFVLPNSCETKLVVTMNARSLYHFFNQRCCNRAQWEIRCLAELMLCEVKKVAPLLFSTAGPPCLMGDCPEGKMSCGKMLEVRAHYKGGEL